ncbi:hypothetical protein ME784_18120 [Lactobacillus delbrueckii]|uniref:polysaccharide pyruvyl transferase family protein n=1 Tax=Lactobacillus delbrueckii TaxID=1584 RepID=UPI001F38571A|nr:polysaccharide pyruvyl transferase family protein [Lactobacillus delbrueckii]GHN21297.1 hypothetical protein ME784_18120 [Lactobacillus delbrueckii]GHN23251.1 hypothetical protein ME785_18090 [Lactobacillus delbrueckii]
MIKHKKILVEFYAKKNFGDDMFVRIIADRYPNTDFYIFGRTKYIDPFKDIENVHLLRDTILIRLIRKICKKLSGRDYIYRKRALRSDLVLRVGGSIFPEPKKNLLTQYFKNESNKISDSPKIVILGSNFGPYKSQIFLDFWRKEFKKCSYVTVRDKASYALFDDIKKVHYAPDILLGINSYLTNKKIVKKKKEKYVAISVVSKAHNKNERQDFVKKIVDLIRYYNDQNIGVVLMSFCEDEGDMDLIKEIQNASRKEVKVLNYQGNVDEVLNCIQNAEYVIGSRFHSIIMALAMRVPCYPISYSNKTENLLHDIHFDGNFSKITEFSDKTLLEIDKNRVKKYICDVTKDEVASESHFRFTDDFLR